MGEEILNILIDYSMNNKTLDSDVLREIFNAYITVYGLEDVTLIFKQVSLNGRRILGSYNNANKRIFLYEGTFDSINANSTYAYKLKKFERMFIKNFAILQTLFHELEHAKQFKETEKAVSGDLESTIIKAATLPLCAETQKLLETEFLDEKLKNKYLHFVENQDYLYRKLYAFDPRERLADISSAEILLSSIEGIRDEYPRIMQVEEALLLGYYLRGYNKGGYGAKKLSPTLYFLCHIYDISKLKQFDCYDKSKNKCLALTRSSYSLQERMKYGLSISKKEYDDKSSRYNSSIIY